MIHPSFTNISRLFVLSFNLWEIFFGKYYMLLVEIKDFNELINNFFFLWSTHKNKQESVGKLAEMSRPHDYATGNLLFILSKLL